MKHVCIVWKIFLPFIVLLYLRIPKINEYDINMIESENNRLRKGNCFYDSANARIICNT